ncbi:MAG: tagatose 1,6-diphosphate aldolase [Bifidobacteriaceae bacterium]|jgi:tagatose 1,6-diphosphate aldolase|nr:tagatose 1,6-diphosphate aldolase [Bifidobacteriaceae bacterium]
MLKLSKNKKAQMDRLSSADGKISALAIDQRGALKKMITALGKDASYDVISGFKQLISSELTKYSSAILLDPEYGLEAARVRDANSGLLLAYEKTGYDATKVGRLPDLLDDWSVLRLKNEGADAVKFLLYYDIDEDPKINHLKHVFTERLGNECAGEDIPFYLELVSYDADNADSASPEYAKVKPHKVNDMMRVFSDAKYKVDVLKVEVPVNMNYVDAYATNGTQAVYTADEAARHFKEQSDCTDLPFIFLSAGVSAALFQETLVFAHDAGSTFNGVLCGRATWKNGVAPFVTENANVARDWVLSEGVKNITELAEVVNKNASSWHGKVEVV